ncbi:MAG: hypothetical protein WD397_10955 [Wenzhouxiangellaceae bacterium]
MKTTKWMALVAIACLAISARPTFGNEIAETLHVDNDLLDDLAEFIHTRREGQR